MKILKKSLSTSSKDWIRRSLQDQYTKKAISEGYKSRAAYKLIQIQEKFGLLKPNSLIIDLGASPGGWSQVAVKYSPNGMVVALDLLPINISSANLVTIQKDFLDPDTPDLLIQALKGEKPNIIMSDLAPNTTGHKSVDSLRIMNMCEQVFGLADSILREQGSVICKIFQGGVPEQELLNHIKRSFKKIKHYKPPASRKESKEIYLIAQDYRKF